MKIIKIETLWPEPENFMLDREDTGNEYIFVHFITPVHLFINHSFASFPSGVCILYNKHSHQKFLSKDCRLIHDWCHITGNLDGIIEKYGFKYGEPYVVTDSHPITSVMQKIKYETLRADVFSEKAIKLAFEELIINIIRTSLKDRGKQINDRVKERFTYLRSKISAEYNHDWTVEKMAAEVNLSSSRFYTLYNEIFGISPKQDLQSMRIEHAKTLLLQNKYLVREIAEMTGYKNQYHFIRQFKKQTGKTPGSYFD